MPVAKLKFKTTPFAVIVTVIAVSIFTYLAVWQVGRAEERKQHREMVLERLAQPVEAFSSENVNLDKDRFKRFSLTGAFLDSHQIFLDNVVKDGKPGYDVITPFKTEKQLLLVNRGWVSAGRDRRILPEIKIDETQQHEIVVMLDKPRSSPVIGIDPVESRNRWNFLDIDHYRQVTGYNVPEYLLQLSPDTGLGYLRKWPEIADKSGMHIGYAIQWSAFAVIAFATFLGLSFKREK